MTAEVRDSSGLIAAPLSFYLEAGVHRLQFDAVQEPMAIRRVILYQPEELPTADQVRQAYRDKGYTAADAQPIKLQAERPDLVITYSIKPNIYAGYLCRLMGIPYCVNVQGIGTAFQKPVLAQLVTRMYQAAVKKARVVFFENEGNAALFREKHITPAEQQVVLRGAGINLTSYPAQPFPANDPVRFLYLGRLMKEKGIDELFEAVRRLHQEGETFVLDLVGFFDGGYEGHVDALQAEGIAVFHGFQQNPRPYYAAADCVVLPSYHEGMSNVLLEAAATGRPLITSDIPGCREAVTAGVSGLLCTPRDSDSLYRAMTAFLNLTPDQRAAMGEAGRQRMELLFAKELVVSETIRAIGDI